MFSIELLLRLLFLLPFLALLLAPLESVGWWAGWWFKDVDRPSDSFDGLLKKTTSPPDYEHIVFYLTGIGGATKDNNVPLEKRFLERLKQSQKNMNIVDTIYPYSVVNRSLTDHRLLARFWRYALHAKSSGNKKMGFVINLRNLFQIFVAADDRYGTFFYQGAASVIINKLLEIGYDPEGGIPITIIGYSGGGQVAVGAAPYLARVVRASVSVISLAGVLSSNPLIGRVDRIVHIVSKKDSVARLGFIFAGRWPINYFSAWNKAKRNGRIKIVRLEKMQHDGVGGYLDENSFFADGQSYFDKTINTIVEILKEKVEPIPDDEGDDILKWLKPNKRY